MQRTAISNASVAQNAETGAKKTPSPQLVQAAHQFEGMMIEQLLKPMTSGVALDDSGDEAGSNGALNDFASESLSQSLSQHGGLGIANWIVRDLSPAGNHPETGKGNQKTAPKGLHESLSMTKAMRKF